MTILLTISDPVHCCEQEKVFGYVCMYMYIYICTCFYVFIYIYIHIHTYIYIYVFIYQRPIQTICTFTYQVCAHICITHTYNSQAYWAPSQEVNVSGVCVTCM